jgi:hypothetical protein
MPRCSLALSRLPGFGARFLHKARATARIHYLGMVQVLDFGCAGSLLYIDMKVQDGDDLGQALKDLCAEGKWFRLDQTVELVREVCVALRYAHGQRGCCAPT